MTTDCMALLVACAGLCAWATWPKPPSVVDTHTATRQFVINATLNRTEDAIIVLGDSIVEGSTLPRSVCGHPIVNAGIGGLSTTTALRERLSSVIEKPAALIVVSLGLNDAAIPNSTGIFRENYHALLKALEPLARHRAVAKITPPEDGLSEARKVDAALIDAYNAVLPDIARQARAGLIEMPSMPVRHSIDGLHLNAAGYDVWDNAIMDGIAGIACNARAAGLRG